MIKSEYFASPVYIEEKNEWATKIDKLCDPYIKQARDAQVENNEKRKTIGYKNDIGQSYHSTPLEPDENFRFLHDYIAKKSRWCLDDMGYDMEKYNLIYTESWVQEFSFNGAGHHWFHTHSNNHISGFFFLQCSEKTSRPSFHDPRPGKTMTDLPFQNSKKISVASNIVNYPVKPGDFIFFNSYMPHAYSHYASEGKEKFRFIHFNMAAVMDPNTSIIKDVDEKKKEKK